MTVVRACPVVCKPENRVFELQATMNGVVDEDVHKKRQEKRWDAQWTNDSNAEKEKRGHPKRVAGVQVKVVYSGGETNPVVNVMDVLHE